MARWIIKAAIQKFISMLPHSEYWYDLFQTYVTKSVRLDDEMFKQKLKKSQQHLALFLRYSARLPNEPFQALELGTGWHPILPISLYLCGADQIWTFDVRLQLTVRRVRDTAAKFIEFSESNQLNDYLPHADARRITQLRVLVRSNHRDLRSLLSQINIYSIVGDAAESVLPDGTIDLFVSNVVLEYISTDELRRICSEFYRLASSNAVMSHDIDLADQYAYFDSTITKFNFLRFSKSKWKAIGNSFTPLNRLRLSDYERVFVDAGFAIVHRIITEGNRNELNAVPLADEFRRYRKDDLAVLRAWLVARPTGND